MNKLDKKTWKLWVLASGCFLFISVMELINKNYKTSGVYITLTLVYLGMSKKHYKKHKNISVNIKE